MDAAQLARLAAVSRALSSYDELDELVQVIVDMAAELSGAESSSLLLFDEEDQVLRYVATSWCGQDVFLRGQVEEAAVALDASVAGWVMGSKKPAAAAKIGRKSLVAPQVARLMPAPALSIAAVPLLYRGLPIGVLESVNHPNGQFSGDEVEVLETLASLAAVAIYNAHLLHRTQNAYEELADLDRMKSEFIAISSHELRTPLGVILGHTALLKEIADRDIREQLEVVERNALQLKEIIENLTVINRLGARQGETLSQAVSLNEIVSRCVEGLSGQARRQSIMLRAEVPGQAIVVNADSEKLLIVLNNLIRNALAFTGGGGRGKVLVSLKKRETQALVSVTDNGIGIPKKDRKRIFERFYQVEDHLRRTHGGMGVGLSTAKYLVERFGGRIWVESLEGEGSCFTFSLPVRDGPGKNRAFLIG